MVFIYLIFCNSYNYLLLFYYTNDINCQQKNFMIIFLLNYKLQSKIVS